MTPRPPGFTLLEVIIALVIVGALGVVGLQTLAQGSRTRARALAYAEARPLLEEKLAELSLLSAQELLALPDTAAGRFPPPRADGIWVVRVEERDPGTLLFRVSVRVSLRDATLRSTTYLNRHGDWQWTPSPGTEPASP